MDVSAANSTMTQQRQQPGDKSPCVFRWGKMAQAAGQSDCPGLLCRLDDMQVCSMYEGEKKIKEIRKKEKEIVNHVS